MIQKSETMERRRGCCNKYLKIFDQSLKNLFRRLGTTIGRHPSHFIVVSIFVCLILGTGLQNFSYVNDTEYLFVPRNGEAEKEREIVENYFPLNYTSRFDPSRITRGGRLARLYITAKDGGTFLRSSIWREVRTLDTLIRTLKIRFHDEHHSFETLCARWGHQNCYEVNILPLGDLMEEIEAGNLTLTYPTMVDPVTFELYNFPNYIGGLQLTNLSTIVSFKAIHILYVLDTNSPLKDLRGKKWEQAIINLLEDFKEKWKFIKIDPMTWQSLDREVDRNNLAAVPYMSFTIPLMIFFTAVTSMMTDWVKSKPFLGIAGVICPTLGTLAAFGLLCYFGVEFCSINIATPFLMLGIGIDDTFVMLAAWRRTNVHDPVEKRMGDAYAEAAISITITSLTDMLSFWVGILTPFRAVQIFSVYTGSAVLGTYLCHLFIFGGAMALSGYHEAKNRHGLLWWRTCTPKSKMDKAPIGKKSRFKFIQNFYTGGIDPSDPHNPLDNPENSWMLFFRDTWASYLNEGKVKILILILFILYIALSLWGISQTKEGFDLRKLARYDSYAGQFFETDDTYFRQFPYRVQVVITTNGEKNGPPPDYSNKTTQSRIEGMMRQFENSKFGSKAPYYSESWLRSFLGMVEKWKIFDLHLNITGQQNFAQNLRENLLTDSSLVFSDDVKFSENGSQILAARFIIQMVNVSGTVEEEEMLRELRAIAKAQRPHLNVTISNWYFIFLDQYMLIRTTTVQCVVIAGLIMMAVSLVFIPNPLCSLWVSFSVVSIETGVLGLIALWNVNLDVISMISLIMCVGFSVDFSAHISYAYITAEVDRPEERVKAALYSLGLPIVQGAGSTILGVSALSLAPSYIHNTFFKSVVLVMVIAAAHGLIILPVLLSLFGPGSPSLVGRMKKIGRIWSNFTLTDAPQTISTQSISKVCQ